MTLPSMKKFLCKGIVSVTLACAAVPTATHADDLRQTILINDGWTFAFADDTAHVAVSLPHTWNADAYSTRDYRRGKGVYTRKFTLSPELAGKRLFLKFDGAAQKSAVTIDGKQVGTHAGAYSPHIIDITGAVTPGTEHTLSVTADNSDADMPPWSADFTQMGGLYRDAWLVGADPIRLDFTAGPACGFKVTPLPEGNGTWRLDVSGAVINDSRRTGKFSVRVTLTAPDGTTVAVKSRSVKPIGNRPAPFNVMFDGLDDVRLWSPENPALYHVRTEVICDGRVTDSATSDTGFRTFGFDDAGRFLLNGKPYKLRGQCRHQDQYPMGIALTDEQHRRDMEMIKDLGANFIRISHYPQDDAVLEMCDRLGLIVWEEVPVIDYVPDSPAFAVNAEAMLREMVRTHYNHPSVAMWGYMNEILIKPPRHSHDKSQQRAVALARHLEKVLAEEDSTRFSTMAFHGSDIYNTSGIAEITDVRGWNLYQGWYGGRFDDFDRFLSRQHREHPAHRLIVSEYGAGSDLRIHSLEPEMFDFSTEYQQKYLEHYLPVIEDSAFVAGASHWNFIDFSSAARGESMPHINNKGLVTNSRRRKDVYYYYKAMWHDITADTVAHIVARDWPARTEIATPGTPVVRPVKVYTNLPEVSLWLNGRCLGTAGVTNRTALFDVPLLAGSNILTLTDPGNGRLLDAAVIDLDIIEATPAGIDPGTRDLAINVGSNCYFRSDDSVLTWLPDREYTPGALYGHSGGKRTSTTAEIALTADDPLCQHQLTGLDSYHISVVPGRYEVELTWADLAAPEALSAYLLGRGAETTHNDITKMDVAINGHSVENAFAPTELSGVRTMVKRRYHTDVSADEGITVTFAPVDGGSTSLSAIKIRRLQ